MDIMLKLRKRVCGYRGTVSSADLEELIFLCPVNLPDSSGHLICHGLSLTDHPVPSAPSALTGQDPTAPVPLAPNNNTRNNGQKQKQEVTELRAPVQLTPSICSWGLENIFPFTLFKVFCPGDLHHTPRPHSWDTPLKGHLYPYLSRLKIWNQDIEGRKILGGERCLVPEAKVSSASVSCRFWVR